MTSMRPIVAATATAVGTRHRNLANLAALLLATTALVGVPAALPGGPAQAASIVWNGSLSTDWADPGNWVSNSFPGAGDGAIINDTSINGTVIGAGVNGVAQVVSVGTAAAGALTISGGGTLNTGDGSVGGALGGARGVVTVTGAGSSWFNTSALIMGSGNSGPGDLNILNGGAVHSAFGIVARDGGSVGSVLVDGFGSQWLLSNTLLVGPHGQGSLTVSGGGLVTAAGATQIGGSGGNGTVTVTGANSTFVASGGLVVGESGTGLFQVLAGGTVTSATGTIGDSAGSVGTALVDGVGSSWDAGSLAIGFGGQGRLTVSNGGYVTTADALFGAHATDNGAATVTGSGSQLNVTNTIVLGADGHGSLTISNGGIVSNNNSYIGQNATGTGSATVAGAGSTWTMINNLLVGDDGHGDLTIAAGGTVVNAHVGGIGNGVTGSGTVTVTGPGSTWQLGSTLTVGIHGSGVLTVADGAVVSATGITIATTVGSTGTVNIGAPTGVPAADPGSLNTGLVAFGLGTGSLNFNHTGTAYTFGAALLSLNATAAVNQLSGTTILTADSSAFFGTTTVSGGKLLVNNKLGGTVNVNGGTLQVDGAIGASTAITVNSGGLLTGVGSVGAPTINAGGTFAPGDGTPGSSMTLASLALQSGAHYRVSVDPATSSFASVTGTATLGGATVNAVFANGSYVAKQYTILTAGSVSGTFDPTVVNSNLPSGFKTSLSYDATHAYLDLAIGFTPPGGVLNVNQQNVGDTLINFFNTNGSIPLVFGSLSPAGLTQLSGETATASQQTTFNAMTQFMGVMTDPFIAGRGDPIGAGGSPNAYADESGGQARSTGAREAYAAIDVATQPFAASFGQRWSVWAAGFGGSQTTDGNAVVGSNDTTSRLYGTAVGADYRFSANTLAGFALAGGGTNFSVINGGGGRSDLFQAGAYLRHVNGPAYITAALAYGWQDVTTDRTVTVAGADRLRGQFNANAYSGRVEGGYRFVTQGIAFTPYAAGQFTTFDLPAYAESVVSGANTFALAYDAKTVTDTRSELGLRSDKSIAMSDGVLTLRGRLAWAHDFNPDRSVASTFQTLPGASFVVNGAAQAANSALVTAAAEKKWVNGWSSAATFEGEFSSVTRSYAGKGVVRYAW